MSEVGRTQQRPVTYVTKSPCLRVPALSTRSRSHRVPALLMPASKGLTGLVHPGDFDMPRLDSPWWPLDLLPELWGVSTSAVCQANATGSRQRY